MIPGGAIPSPHEAPVFHRGFTSPPQVGYKKREWGGGFAHRRPPELVSLFWRARIPVPVPVDHSTLLAEAAKHVRLSGDPPCPRCGDRGALAFTGRLVPRGVVTLARGSLAAFHRVPIPLARCAACRFTVRVLPADFLPRKTYTLPVIETATRRYVADDGPGLRSVVDELGHHAPAHSTLHRWLSGLGDRTLDRRPSPAPTPTAAALVVESERRWGAPLRSLPTPADRLPAWKYHSEQRHDPLRACVRLFAWADAVVPRTTLPLTAWQARLIAVFGVAAWVFPTRPLKTAVQLPAKRSRPIRSRPSSRSRSRGAAHGPRSPPHRRLSF